MDGTVKDIRIQIPDAVLFAAGRLESFGYTAYLVGGCVRDAVMGTEPKDYDLCTSALPERMLEVFSDCRLVETGLKHGTVTLVKDGMNIEITTYRLDGAYRDGRHPEKVTFTDRISEDLKRRDFTINAMAYSPSQGLLDLFGGCDDIEKKTVRCVGRAEDRFSEDGLRILRALRFSSVLGFTPDEECSDAARRCAHMLGKISRERIFSEIRKTLEGKDADRILFRYGDVVAAALDPELEPDILSKGGLKFRKDTGKPEAVMRLATLLDGENPQYAKNIFSSLKPSRAESKLFSSFLEHRADAPVTEYGFLKLISRTDDSFAFDLIRYELMCGRLDAEDAAEREKTVQKIIREDMPRGLKDLQVTGSDLAETGLEGRLIGDCLEHLLDLVMRKALPNSKDALMAEAARFTGPAEKAKNFGTCDSCEFYDDKWGDGVLECTKDLDEDELYRAFGDRESVCPYYKFYDEYKSVEKQN